MNKLFTPGRISELDGFRAIAVLLVVFTHIFQTVPNLSFVAWNVEWATPLFNGWTGVDLFFVLSGFLIGGQIFTQLEKGQFSFSRFYLRRAFRILPAYFVVLLLVCILGLTLSVENFKAIAAPLSWSGLLKNIFLVENYFPHGMAVGSWSLSIEEQFYWIIPCVLVALHKREKIFKTKFFLLVCGLALLLRILTYRHFGLGPEADIYFVQQKIYFPFHTRMDGLAAGVLVYLAAASTDLKVPCPLPYIARTIGIYLSAFVIVTGALKGGWLETTLQYSIISLGFALLVWGVLNESEKKKSTMIAFLNFKIWIPVARLSYSLFLIHLLAMSCTSLVFKHFSIENHWSEPIAALVVSFISAFILYLTIEKPIHEWSVKRYRS